MSSENYKTTLNLFILLIQFCSETLSNIFFLVEKFSLITAGIFLATTKDNNMIDEGEQKISRDFKSAETKKIYKNHVSSGSVLFNLTPGQ